MTSVNEKQKLVKWLYQLMLDYLEEVKTYEDRLTYQQTETTLMSFVGGEVPRKIKDYE